VLVYGDRDRETPPEIGTRLKELIQESQLYLLRGFDHWTVLTEGRHQLLQRLGEFVEQVS
jgi:pimeloyl-ACP methyl ester carboxylesterase